MASMQGHNPEKLSQGETNATELIFSTLNGLWTRLKDILAGENFPKWEGGYIQVAATGPDYYEPDLTASGYDAYGDANKLILGFDYFGSGGTIYVTTYADEVRAVTMRDSATHGVQSKAIQCKKIWGTTESPATTACNGTTGELGIYLTKVIKE